MKLFPTIMAFVFGCALGGWFGHQASTRIRSSASVGISSNELYRTPQPTPIPKTLRKDEILVWSQIESTNYHQYVENLVALGCPRETVLDIIIGELNKLFATKWKENVTNALTPYWISGPDLLTRQSQFRSRRDQFESEKADILKSLLGADLVVESKKYEYSQFSEVDLISSLLSPSVRESARFALNSIATNVLAQRSPSVFRGTLQTALDGLITTQELELIIRYASPTAQHLRDELFGFKATQAEFEALFALKLTLEEVMGQNQSEPMSAERNSQAFEDYQRNFKMCLGEDRFKQYQYSTAGDYRQLFSVVTANGLSDEVLDRAYREHLNLQSNLNIVTKSRTLSPAEKVSTIADLKANSTTTLRQVLGDSAYNQFKQRRVHDLELRSRN